MWRRASGSRRRLLHGLIQVAVGYEHQNRGNPRGMRSLLRQGAAKLAPFSRRAGIRELREVALRHADVLKGAPPKIMLNIEGFTDRAPSTAIRVPIPRR